MNSVTVTLRKIGNSLGIILPKEATQMLNAKEGESLTLTQSPDGLRLSSYDPEFEQKMERGQAIIARYKNALRELAK